MTTAKPQRPTLTETQQRVSHTSGDRGAVVASTVDECLAEARAHEALNAFAELDEADVRAHAESVEARLDTRGFPSRVAGVPIALPDDLVTTWGRTRNGSRMLGDYRSPVTATAAQRLLDAGAIPFGKTNIDAFAIGHSTERSDFGPTLHPRVEGRLAGGASGGAAAAVAAGIVPAALAVDTLGSLRQPAAHCGVVGFRPTYGAVSRLGIMANASSMDALGVVARTVQDVAWVFSVIAGHDPADGTSTPLPAEDVIVELNQGASGLRVGVSPELLALGTTAENIAAIENAKAAFRSAGATIVDVSLPLAEHYASTASLLATAEASSNLSRYDGVRFGHRTANAETIDELYMRSRAEGFDDAVKRTALLGTLLLSEEHYASHYVFAQRLRRKIVEELKAAMRGCDILLYPPTVGHAPAPGETPEDPLLEAQLDRFSAAASLASLPAITLNAGVTSDGLPVGVELAGARNSEPTLLRAAYALERALAPHTYEPRT